jgi:predicted phosphodiesterase
MPNPVIVISDLHIPAHDPYTIDLILKVIDASKSDCIIGGDYIDGNIINRFDKDPAYHVSVKKELEAANKILDSLRSAVRGRIHYLSGNHCNLYERFIARRAPELYGMVSLEELLRLKDRNIKYTPFATGKFTYAWETYGPLIFHCPLKEGQDPCGATLNDLARSFVAGHTHVPRTVSKKMFTGETITGIITGHLCNIKSKAFNYVKGYHRWSQSFAYLRKEGKHIHMSNILISQNGNRRSCIVDGELFSV